jgi:hypothetical protein
MLRRVAPDDEGIRILWNVGSYKSYMPYHPRRRHFSRYLLFIYFDTKDYLLSRVETFKLFTTLSS